MTTSQHPQDAERLFIEQLRPMYEGIGYDFRPYPDKRDLPDFMGRYQPDAIALKTSNNVAIEVKNRRNREIEFNIQTVRHLFDGRTDWTFRVFYINDEEEGSELIGTGTSELFVDRLEAAQELLMHGQAQAAFLLSWSLLEAAARMVEPDLGDRSYAPGTVIQALAMSGRIDPDRERWLRDLIGLRNKVVHGDLGAVPRLHEVEGVLSSARDVFEQAKSA